MCEVAGVSKRAGTTTTIDQLRTGDHHRSPRRTLRTLRDRSQGSGSPKIVDTHHSISQNRQNPQKRFKYAQPPRESTRGIGSTPRMQAMRSAAIDANTSAFRQTRISEKNIKAHWLVNLLFGVINRPRATEQRVAKQEGWDACYACTVRLLA